MRRLPPAIAEVMAVTILATTRHFLQYRAPKMVSPPERRKRREAKIPGAKIPKE